MRVAPPGEPADHGVPVVRAGTGFRGPLLAHPDNADQIPRLKELLREYPHLWVDNSGLANPARFQHLPVLAKDELITSRTLYGPAAVKSSFPTL